jgi:hypothetical protein
MTEVLEAIAVELAGPDEDECPFPHFPKKPGPDNYWTNDSGQLGGNLARESANGTTLHLAHIEATTIDATGSGKKDYDATYNPHHLLPGGACWPKTALKKWIDKKEKSLVQTDIGYNVNCYENGIDLPSSNAMRGNWTTQTPDFQKKYAFAAMDADAVRRQFHDSHKAYSEFAIKVLNKIAAKLDAQVQSGKVGCDADDCPAKPGKPYPTPDILPRILDAGARFAKCLWGDSTKWRKPIFTSKFALMYQNRNLTHAQAQAELSPDQFA